MPGQMILRVWDVQHGACAMLTHESEYGMHGRLAMVDSGDNGLTGWKPSAYIKHYLKRNVLDYLFITNADLDHISDLNNLWREGITVSPLLQKSQCAASGAEDHQRSQRRIDRGHQAIPRPSHGLRLSVDAPFERNMGGITATAFWNSYPRFYDTNNLSLVVFFKFGPFKILFPGDLEEDGWLALLGTARLSR